MAEPTDNNRAYNNPLRCGKTHPNPKAPRFEFRCIKKVGHTGEHVDAKAYPAFRWKDKTDG